MFEVPKGTTHVWEGGVVGHTGFYYKKSKTGAWMFYKFSERSWFLSNNDEEWFRTEKKEKFLNTLRSYKKRYGE